VRRAKIEDTKVQFRETPQGAQAHAGNGGGITDKLWSVENIVALVEASEPKRGKRGPYRKRVAA
jgi:hypothetical protein